MNNKDLEHFKTLIINNYLSATDNNGSFDDLDNLNNTQLATVIGNKCERPEEILYFINRSEAYIDKMLAALERIAYKKYGVCASCGEEIPRDRLEEVPHTRYCVQCKSM